MAYITSLQFGPTYMQVTEIMRPKSVWVKELNAKVGHVFAISCDVGPCRKQALNLKIQNISIPEGPLTWVSQEQFFNQFAGLINGAFSLEPVA